MPWTEKHRPKNFEEVKGQDEVVGKIKSFIDSFQKGAGVAKVAGRGTSKKKALLLYGPPGTGKTTIAYVIAKETNSEIFELNASDLRNKDKLQQILKPAVEQKSLVYKNKIILVDEVDGISGYQDRGGITELLRIITASNSDPWLL